jgi:hypothetical protein
MQKLANILILTVAKCDTFCSSLKLFAYSLHRSSSMPQVWLFPETTALPPSRPLRVKVSVFVGGGGGGGVAGQGGGFHGRHKHRITTTQPLFQDDEGL